MDEIISYTICAVKVRNAKLRNYLNNILSNSLIPKYLEIQGLSSSTLLSFETQSSHQSFSAVKMKLFELNS